MKITKDGCTMTIHNPSEVPSHFADGWRMVEGQELALAELFHAGSDDDRLMIRNNLRTA